MKIKSIIFVLSVLGLISCASHPWYTKDGFSPWIIRSHLGEWMEKETKAKPSYVTAVEGRMHEGNEEYRVRLAPAPQNVEWYWYWWYSMDQDYYERRTEMLTKQEGFKCIWTQSYMHSDGKLKYQAVYLKIVDPKKSP